MYRYTPAGIPKLYLLVSFWRANSEILLLNQQSQGYDYLEDQLLWGAKLYDSKKA